MTNTMNTTETKYMIKGRFGWQLTDAGVDLITQCGECCENCPFNNLCADKDLYYSCYVWEEKMGDNL